MIHLSSIYDSKVSALNCTKLPTKSNIQQIFDSTSNPRQNLSSEPTSIDEKENSKFAQQKKYIYNNVNNSLFQNVESNFSQPFEKDDTSYSESYNFFKGNFHDRNPNDQLIMEFTPNAQFLPPISSKSFQSILLFKIDQCRKKCDMNNQKIVNQKLAFLDEIGDLFNQNDFQAVASVFPKEINLKQKILSMIYINICSTKVFYTSMNSSFMISSMYSDKYEDKSLDQRNKSVFLKQILKILNGMIKSLSISDFSILMKICEDFLSDEYDQFFNFFANYIFCFQNKSMEIFNMLCQLLCNYTKSSPYLKKTILPLIRVLVDNLMISNRMAISKTVLNIMIPLIKDKHFQFYSGEFVKLIGLISENFSNVYKFLIVYILKYFPQTNTKKQVILIKMMIKCLTSISTKDFSSNNYKLMNSFVKVLSNCIISPSSIVSLAAFQFFYERSVNTFISINKQLVFDNLLPASMYALKNHWLEKVRKDASFAISILKHSGANFENCMLKKENFLDSNPMTNIQVSLSSTFSQIIPQTSKINSILVNSSSQRKDSNLPKRIRPFTPVAIPNSEMAPPRGVLPKNQATRITFANSITVSSKVPKSINSDLKKQPARLPQKVSCMHTLLPSNQVSPAWSSSSKKAMKVSSSPIFSPLNDAEFNFFENSINDNENDNDNGVNSYISISKLDAWMMITRLANDNDNSINTNEELEKINKMFLPNNHIKTRRHSII